MFSGKQIKMPAKFQPNMKYVNKIYIQNSNSERQTARGGKVLK